MRRLTESSAITRAGRDSKDAFLGVANADVRKGYADAHLEQPIRWRSTR